MKEVIKLTRWQEFLPFTVPVTLLGGLMAHRYGDATLDWRLLWVLLGNCAAVAYAFMVNDIEDSEDDKHDADRARANAVATGELNRQTGWLASIAVAAIALVFYALAGRWALILGVAILVLAHLYSWKPVRLKALPVVDLVSHVLFLAALLMLASYLIYDETPAEGWRLVGAITLISAYGQLYNQVRDYAADRAAGLRNSASILGKSLTQVLSYLTVVGAVGLILWSILDGAFPLWLGGVGLVALPLVLLIARGRDMRGTVTNDFLADVQVQVLLVVNIVLLAWLAAIVLG